jgi:hypothetical protein
MKQKPHMLLLVLGLALSLHPACKSSKATQAQTGNQTEAGKCGQTIKYYCEKVKMPGGEELNFHTEITVNPTSRLISLSSEPPNNEKVTFTIVIESVDCNFNADHTIGQALYHGYINQKDGTTTKIILKLEADDGILSFSKANPEKGEEMVMIVSKWEIVNE